MRPATPGPRSLRLRDRLVRMGYLAPTRDRRSMTAALQAAVLEFQLNHGLTADGVASEATLAEINIGPEERLKSVIVAMERERWMHYRPLGPAYLGQPARLHAPRSSTMASTVFETRVVIGKNVPDQRSPEFSDVMEHMVINPSWGVPRSIIVKEYLPLLQRNPNAVGASAGDRRARAGGAARRGRTLRPTTRAAFPSACASRRRTAMRWGW